MQTRCGIHKELYSSFTLIMKKLKREHFLEGKHYSHSISLYNHKNLKLFNRGSENTGTNERLYTTLNTNRRKIFGASNHIVLTLLCMLELLNMLTHCLWKSNSVLIYVA